MDERPNERATAIDDTTATAAGRVAFLHVTPAAGEPMQAVAHARAVARTGLLGDRYASGSGHWSAMRRSGDELTLIEAEELDAIAAVNRLDLPPGATRRNVTTRGVRLPSLIGRPFRIGEVECRGTRRCEPCSYLDGLLRQDVLPALIHRGGIRAEITKDGLIRVGDVVERLGDR